METAKLFRNGGSQAVRLPKGFSFEGNEVRITQEGRKVILEPIEKRSWPEGYWQSWQGLDLEEVPARLPNPVDALDL